MSEPSKLRPRNRGVTEYQLRATQCARLARTAKNLQAKIMLLEMARAWQALAEQAIKNSETVLLYEPPQAARR